MNWLKNNWVWLALLAAGGLGLYFFGKSSNPGSEYLDQARAAKAAKRQAEAAGLDEQEISGSTDNGQAVTEKPNA